MEFGLSFRERFLYSSAVRNDERIVRVAGAPVL
jgi:hypothetical protein